MNLLSFFGRVAWRVRSINILIINSNINGASIRELFNFFIAFLFLLIVHRIFLGIGNFLFMGVSVFIIMIVLLNVIINNDSNNFFFWLLLLTITVIIRFLILFIYNIRLRNKLIINIILIFLLTSLIC